MSGTRGGRGRVRWCRQVGPDLWLAAHRVRPGRPGEARRESDRAAAHLALADAVKWSGAGAGACSHSLAHTEGVGAALISLTRRQLGVDVVAVKRVGPRHAHAVTDAEEWNSLEAAGLAWPPLVWGLKEAAAKATGDPARYFASGLSLTTAPDGGLEVLADDGDGDRRQFSGGWQHLGGYLFAWVCDLTE